MATKKRKRKPPKVEAYGRHEFELTISSNCKKASDIVDLYNRGALGGDEYCFLFEDVLNIAKKLAYGWWNNAALRQNPKSKWAIEQRSTMVQQSIMEAFTSIPDKNNIEADKKKGDN